MDSARTALVVFVPEADPLVGTLRKRCDPSAAAGVAAHVTVLFPFLEAAQIDEEVLARLAACFAAFAPFDVGFSRTRRFPGSLYLAPEPAEPLRALTLAVWERFPSHPPYGGRHGGVVPHLTLAQLPDEARLDAEENAFLQQAEGKLPLVSRVREVTLIENATGKWRVQKGFPLSVRANPT